MNKKVKIAGAIFVGLFVLSQPFVLNPIFAFIFTGTVPGTRTAIPFWAMMMLLVAIGWLAISWLFRQPLLIGDDAGEEKAAKARARTEVLRATRRRQAAAAAPVAIKTRRTRKGYAVATTQ